MAIGAGTLLEITLVQSFLNSGEVLNVFQYEVGGSFGTSSAVDWAVSWWNHVKSTVRAICPSNASPFRSVKIREMDDPAGAYGEFSIPTGEWVGTRTPPGGDWLPQFVSAGFRMTVGTRATRPGQKRFAYLAEGDCDGTYIAPSYLTPFTAMAAVLVNDMTLGAPVAGGLLHPIVTRKDPASGAVTAWQRVTGAVVNPLITSQVSRKFGRGA